MSIESTERVLNAKSQDKPKVFFQIERESIKDEARSLKDGCARYVDKVFLVATKVGSTTPITNRYEIEPRNRARLETHVWLDAGGEEYYKRWKAGDNVDAITDGTPLKMWPLITPAQIKELEHVHIRTVEALAEMGDSDLSFMGLRNLRDKAQAWVKEAQDRGVITEENAAMRAEMAEMKDAMREMKETMKRQQDKLNETFSLEMENKELKALLEEASEPKRGQGRPARTEGKAGDK